MKLVPKPTTLGLLLAGVGFVWFAIRWANAAVSPRDLFNGQGSGLADCPNRPNCVCSNASRAGQRVPELPLRESSTAAMSRLKAVIEQMPGGRVVLTQDHYLRAEFTSRVWGFKDDLELLAEPGKQRIGIRSASRVGRSDLGVNRKRVEHLRRLYEAGLAASNK